MYTYSQFFSQFLDRQLEKLSICKGTILIAPWEYLALLNYTRIAARKYFLLKHHSKKEK